MLRSRSLLLALASLFGAATVAYAAIWMHAARWTPLAGLGIEYGHSAAEACLYVEQVSPGGAGAEAGLLAGDRVVAINDHSLATLEPLSRFIDYGGRPGDLVLLSLQRPGVLEPIALRATLQPVASDDADRRLARHVAIELLLFYPVLFVVVGLAVLFLRIDDHNAWLLALLFGGFVAAAPLLPFEFRIPSGLRGFALAYKVLFHGSLVGLFVYFFSVFPTRSPLDLRAPWLKSLWLAGGVVVALPLASWALWEGRSQPVLALWNRLGPPVLWLAGFYSIGGVGLGLVSLLWSAVGRAATPDARRKGRVIVWGTLLGMLPGLVMQAVAAAFDLPLETMALPFWLRATSVIALLLIPLSFAYAVVKDRVLEIPVLLRRSARYLLVQRGSIGLLLGISATATLTFAFAAAGYLKPRTEAALPVGVALGAAFGTVLVWTGTRVHRRVRERVDRAFFRRAYDARHILQDLAERTRQATDRQELASLLEEHLEDALLPRSLVIYFGGGERGLEAVRGAVPPALETLPVASPALEKLAERGRPWDVPPPGSAGHETASALAPLEPECLVPILGRDARLLGLFVLGQRLSEEPYSGEDKRLLASVAGQAGLVLDSLELAERMAERLEAERRSAHEMKLAKQVQSRLLPQSPPRLSTLECAADCIQARAVGGDYYDFLDLGPGRVGLTLGDVSGKGFPAALLMANLQASLRSRSPQAMEQLPEQLGSVNRLLYMSSTANRFATLFLGIYDDATRRLRYANCGHNPPVLLRADGGLERLEPTAMALGLLEEEFDCTTNVVELGPDDLLTLFTDGITEALSDDGEEFGEERLIETLRERRELPIRELLQKVVSTVVHFSGTEQEDDLTLLVARGLPPAGRS